MADKEDLTMDEFLDGFALWEEHRPQTAEDWLAVAERCAADPGYDITKSHVLLQAAVLAVRQRDEGQGEDVEGYWRIVPRRAAVDAYRRRFTSLEDAERVLEGLPHKRRYQVVAYNESGKRR